MSFLHQASETSVVEPREAAQAAHDALLASQPSGAKHATCELCPDVTATKEVAKVGDADRTYTEVEHIALTADAVTRETAELTQVKADLEGKLSAATAQVDVLEAEKAKLATELADATKAFEDYKAGIEALAAVEARKDERKDAVKAANEALPDAYFSAERVQAWAEMDEATFGLVVEGLKAVGGSTATGTKTTAAFAGGRTATAVQAGVKGFLAARSGEAN